MAFVPAASSARDGQGGSTLKKHRDYEDELNEATKAKEVTAYEDSWYRSLKALADMRPTETEVRPASEEVHPAPEDEKAAADEQYAAAEDVHPPAEEVPHSVQDVRAIESDEETAGLPED
jgi:hypothetical protein